MEEVLQQRHRMKAGQVYYRITCSCLTCSKRVNKLERGGLENDRDESKIGKLRKCEVNCPAKEKSKFR
jgi:hypothetical protein